MIPNARFNMHIYLNIIFNHFYNPNSMKHMFKTLAAVALIALAASCSKDAAEAPAVVDETAKVSFTVELPGIASRATNDGTTATELHYAVYQDNGNNTNTLLFSTDAEDQVKTMSGLSTTVELDLVSQQTYDIVFWAQAPGAYDPDFAAKSVAMNYNSNKVGSNEQRDAFVYVWNNLTVNGSINETVTLRRPFAQLNVALTDGQIEAAQKAGFTLDQVKVSAKTHNAFGFFAAEQGAPVGEMIDIEFAAADYELTPNTIKVNNVDYDWVSFNYLLACTPSELVDVTIVFENENDAKTIEVPAFTNVPIERNHRTNIVGDLLTDPAKFEVVILPGFENDEHVVEAWDGKTTKAPTQDTNGNYLIEEASELAWLADQVNGISRAAANNFAGQTFLLGADINLGGHPWTPIGFNPNELAGNETYFAGTFDGGGHTISNLKIDATDVGGIGLFGAVHNATFKNFTLQNVDIKAVESESDPANTSGAQGNSAYIAGGHLGAIAGYDAKAGTIVFENVHVKGLIKIEGETRVAQGQRIGGIIGGRGSSTYSFKNVSVIGDEGSYIKGFCSTAGVIGQNQEAATFEHVTTDIDIYAVTFGAGGIAGIVRQGSTFTNCSSAGDILLDASSVQPASYSGNYFYRIGGIAGCWSESKTGKLTLTNCSYTGTLTSYNKEGVSPASFDYAGYVGRGYALFNCAGSTVTINGVNYVQAYDNEFGIYIIDGVYGITKANLGLFRDKVNAGETFAGKTVALIEDIDLENQQWAPIGKGETFNGVFDGNNKTISNLKYYAEGEDYFVGLFGCLDDATVKNLTMTNVDIRLSGAETWGHIGAVAGWAEGTSTLENITVNGTVKIEGEMTEIGSQRIGGVVGGNQGGNVTLKGVKVEADANSYVKGNAHVGGIAGQLQGSAIFENCASAINVIAYKHFAGGIIGLAPTSIKLTNCQSSGNSSVVAGRAGNANDLYRVGGIAGGWDDNLNTPMVLENCSYTGTISGQDENGVTATDFVCGGYVGRGWSALVGATVQVNGTTYVYQGDGKQTINGATVISVNPQNVGSIKFDEEATYQFNGNFTGEVKLTTAGGKAIILDGSKATFDNNIVITFNRIADNKNDLTTERSGNYKVVGFSLENSLNVRGNAVKSLSIEGCKAYMMTLNVSNTKTTLKGNTIIRPATAEDSYKRHDGGSSKDILQVYADNYELELTGNTIKDEKGVSNVIELFGLYDWQGDATWTNKITMQGNTLSTVAENTAVMKIYNDVTFAPVIWPAEYYIPAESKALAKQLAEQNTLSYGTGSYPLDILCRANGLPDSNIKLYGNE